MQIVRFTLLFLISFSSVIYSMNQSKEMRIDKIAKPQKMSKKDKEKIQKKEAEEQLFAECIKKNKGHQKAPVLIKQNTHKKKKEKKKIKEVVTSNAPQLVSPDASSLPDDGVLIRKVTDKHKNVHLAIDINLFYAIDRLEKNGHEQMAKNLLETAKSVITLQEFHQVSRTINSILSDRELLVQPTDEK